HRFRSECPPAEGGEGTSGGGQIEWMERMFVQDMPGGGIASNSSTLRRTYSCPMLVDECTSAAAAMMTSSGAVPDGRNQTDGGAEGENRKARRAVNMIECFPYLALINEPCGTFFQTLEDELEDHHEKNREMYMKAKN
ncbi:hypothetical protein PMAYCL1PPCAC_04923, partial [Pristionchus mayeri]